MKVLITGFDPFGGETMNPAWEAVKLLKDEIGGAPDHQAPDSYGGRKIHPENP